jgi:hypothetical protein
MAASSGSAAAPQPIVEVVREGGLCPSGGECRLVLRITDTTISGQGYSPPRLSRSARSTLLHAVAALSWAKLRARTFEGTCPTAYDGTEAVYRFRGFSQALSSCRYDLRRVEAAQWTERLLATMKPR